MLCRPLHAGALGLLQEVELGRGLSHKVSLSGFLRVPSSLGMITALGMLDIIQPQLLL